MMFLPLIGYTPAMPSHTTVNIVWLSTSADQWSDTSSAQGVIHEAVEWWHVQSGIDLTIEESDQTITTDVNALDVCHDRHWLPDSQADVTLYMVAWQPTDRILVCDDVNVADYTLPGTGIVWGGIRPAELAHTIGHLYGASDESVPGIMQFATMEQSYKAGLISAETRLAMGLN